MGSLEAGRRGLFRMAAAVLAGSVMPAQSQDAVVWGGAHNSILGGVEWRDHFDSLTHGAILADTRQRTLHFWSEDERVYRRFPSSVPSSRDLTRLGLTRVIRKVEGPTWRPTPSMRERNPSLPALLPAGPDNPLGTHALYLSWDQYRLHGTHDARQIGRPSPDGCIGLRNDHIAELFALARVGTQVRLI